MNGYLWVNFIAFLFVTVYAISLFIYLIKTRTMYIKLGKKVEFERNVKERLHKIWVNVFGQKKLLKDKKSGIMHVMFFYGFILVQFGAIDFIIKGIKPGAHLPLGPLYPGFTFFQEIVTLVILVAVVWAFYRRYIEKLVRLKRNLNPARSYFYWWINAFCVAWKRNEHDLAWPEATLDRTGCFHCFHCFLMDG